MDDEFERALDRCSSFSPEAREIGRRDLERLFRSGLTSAGVELAHLVISEGHQCALGKGEAAKLLQDEVRRSGDARAFLNLYYHGADLIPDAAMEELLVFAAPTCSEAAEILEARLPGWRHPSA